MSESPRVDPIKVTSTREAVRTMAETLAKESRAGKDIDKIENPTGGTSPFDLRNAAISTRERLGITPSPTASEPKPKNRFYPWVNKENPWKYNSKNFPTPKKP